MGDWSEAQRKTIEGLSPKGFHVDAGEPCECGAVPYTTSSKVGYSDFMTYTHRCGNCGNEFSTYIEG